jgi:hypothetical protein
LLELEKMVRHEEKVKSKNSKVKKSRRDMGILVDKGNSMPFS